MNNIGYCCINLTLKPLGISTNREIASPITNLRVKKYLYDHHNGKLIYDDNTIRDWYDLTSIEGSNVDLDTSFRTFKTITKSVIVDNKINISEHSVSKKGHLEWLCRIAGDKAMLNLIDLLTILKWNVENNIRIFRFSSSLFPWMSEYDFTQLPNYSQIKVKLIEIGNFVLGNDLRVGFHPGQYCVLPSPTENVVLNSINDLDKHSQILDLMGLPVSHEYSLNIHVGGSYGDKDSTLARFITNFSRLGDTTQRRLVIENDDKASQYSVYDLYHGLHKHIQIPITFDFFHHAFCTGGMSVDEAATLAASTWPTSIRPLAHVSNSRKLFEDDSVMERSHSDFIYEKIPSIGSIFDIELEAKAKEHALLKYHKQYNN